MSNKNLHSFSHDGNYLAICQPNGVLKIWNTTNNILVHEFQPSEHLKATTTCLSFSKGPTKKKFTKKKKKKPNDNTTEGDDVNTQLIAMGTVAGTVFLYNPSLEELVNTLEHSSTSPVLDLEWQTDNILVTLGADGYLIYWSIIQAKNLRHEKVGKNSSMCLLARNLVVVGSLGIKLLNLSPENKSMHKYTGHKNQITHLAPIHSKAKEPASHFLSAAEDERFVYAWSASSDSHDPVASFSIKDTVRSISCLKLDETSVNVIVVTKKGILQYFNHHLNGVKKQKPLKSKNTLRIELEDNSKQVIPIIAAYFVSKDIILFVYGSELYLRAERISISKISENETFKRSDPSLFTQATENKLLKTVTPNVSNDVVHLTPSYFNEKQDETLSVKRKRGDSTIHMPMEERLNALSIEKPLFTLRKGPIVSDKIHLLMQGLHSKDSTLLYSVLMKGDDEEVVNNTVKNLPVKCIVPLLESLQELLMGKGLRNLTLINWIKSIMVYHMSHLSTLPNKKDILDPFYTMSSARMTTLPEVTKLHSRLDLLLTHVTSRHDNSMNKQAEQDPLLLYREESDEEQDQKLETTALFSESEDFADTWSEDEMEDDQSDDEMGKSSAENTGISGSDQDSKRGKRNSSTISEDADNESIVDVDSSSEKMEDSDESPNDYIQMSGNESEGSSV